MAGSHARMAPSSPPENARRPSGRNARHSTDPSWPRHTPREAPVAGSHERTVRSALADSTVWGVNYQRESFPGTYTPAPAFLAPSLGINAPIHGILQASQLVFGIGVQRAPPCFDTTSFSDDFVGYGSQNVLPSNVSAGDFRLVWQTSPTGKPKAGDQQTTTTTVSLPPPPAGVRISSWASIVE